jgi:hypothetical protein
MRFAHEAIHAHGTSHLVLDSLERLSEIFASHLAFLLLVGRDQRRRRVAFARFAWAWGAKERRLIDLNMGVSFKVMK